MQQCIAILYEMIVEEWNIAMVYLWTLGVSNEWFFEYQKCSLLMDLYEQYAK